jgi:hypothetical protein
MHCFLGIFQILFLAVVASFGGANEMNQPHRTISQQELSMSFATSSNLRHLNQFFREPENSKSSTVSALNVDNSQVFVINSFPRGGGGISSLIPPGYHPFGYKITELGTQFLEFEGSLDSDVGRFLASVKKRKQLAELKAQWLEILRVAKSAQTMRIYRTMDELISFCIKARLLD